MRREWRRPDRAARLRSRKERRPPPLQYDLETGERPGLERGWRDTSPSLFERLRSEMYAEHRIAPYQAAMDRRIRFHLPGERSPPAHPKPCRSLRIRTRSGPANDAANLELQIFLVGAADLKTLLCNAKGPLIFSGPNEIEQPGVQIIRSAWAYCPTRATSRRPLSAALRPLRNGTPRCRPNPGR